MTSSHRRSSARRRTHIETARDRQLVIRFSDEELEAIRRCAGAEGMAVGAWVGSLVARTAVGERPTALTGWQDLLGELVRGRLLIVRAARAVTTGQAGLGGGAEPAVLMEQVLRQLDSLIERAAVHAEREQQL